MLFLSSLPSISLFCALTTYVAERVSVLWKTCKTAGVCYCSSKIAKELSALCCLVSLGPNLVVSEFKNHKRQKCKTVHGNYRCYYLFIALVSCFLLEQIFAFENGKSISESWHNLPSGGCSPDNCCGLSKRLRIYSWWLISISAGRNSDEFLIAKVGKYPEMLCNS